jgi:hypothetical protein
MISDRHVPNTLRHSDPLLSVARQSFVEFCQPSLVSSCCEIREALRHQRRQSCAIVPNRRMGHEPQIIGHCCASEPLRFSPERGLWQ